MGQAHPGYQKRVSHSTFPTVTLVPQGSEILQSRMRPGTGGHVRDHVCALVRLLTFFFFFFFFWCRCASQEGPRELKDAGKGGFVAIQTQFSVVLATILIR